MMNKAGSERIILLDADVVSHFIIGQEAATLSSIFTYPLYLLDKVHAELQRWPRPDLLSILSDLLRKKQIQLIPFPEENETIKKEYAWIKSMMFKGDGESACLAVARFQQNILASSNLTDIKHYCERHRIEYLTTMDFLCEALRKGIFDVDRCNMFLYKVRASGSKLPVTNMQDFICRDLSRMNTL